MSLEPIDPETALELYMADRENNVTEATIYSHRSRLGHFVRWCECRAEMQRTQDNRNVPALNTHSQVQKWELWFTSV